MRKLYVPILGLFVLLGLAQCHSKAEKDLVGVWQLQQMKVGSTTLPGSSMGNWLWEFNEAGGYLADVAGMREKGFYTLKDSSLTLQLGKDKSKPGQVYKITRLDAVELDLVSNEKQTTSELRFKKRSVGDVNQDKD